MLIALGLLFLAMPLAAQQAVDPAVLTLDRVFQSSDFFPGRFGPVRWLEDGSGYAALEFSSQTGNQEIARYDPATGRRDVIAAFTLPYEGRDGFVQSYTFSPDGSKIMLFANTRRVWRQNTRGDYWIYHRADGGVSKLGGDGPSSTMMFAKFSPDGTRVAYVRQNNIYVQRLDDGHITQITHDGTRTLINGTFDWVYEEEFGLRDGFRWSPDGTKIAYWQLDAEGVRDFLMINNTDSLYSYVIPVQYPKAGTTNSACRVGVVSAEGGETTWFEPTDDLRNHYIARMDWAANSDEILFQHLNRQQNTLEMMLGNVHNGAIGTIFTERDDAWIDVRDDLQWLDDGARFTWVSERDGWRHAYLVERTGMATKLITPGAFDIMSVAHIDEAGGWLYYIASPENPTQRYLFRTPLRGGGSAERLTPENQPGTHSYQISADARWAIHTYSSFETPPVIDLVRLPDHTVVRTLVDNAGVRARVEGLRRGEAEFFRVDIGDGVALDGWMIKPSDFDPTRRYPVFFYVYGEPWGQTVLDRWGGSRFLWHTMLAEQGYLVMSIDNRGTPAPRGRDWRKIVYGEVGVLASADQAAAVRAINQWPFVDSTRIGIWGWSGGGSMTLNALFRYPDLYHTGMSVAPVPDQRFYDTIYQERYMGTPQDNPDGYRRGSPITYAENLKGNLLLVHGTGDDNVHYQGTEALINRLVAHNKHFTMMAYPNRSHGIFEGRGTTRHLFGLLTRYPMDTLQPGPVTVVR